MQPQGHVQVISNMIDHKMDPQSALDAPRFFIQAESEKGDIWFEDGISEMTIKELENMGHKVHHHPMKSWDRIKFGVGQIITKNKQGVLVGGTDGRYDSSAIGWC